MALRKKRDVLRDLTHLGSWCIPIEEINLAKRQRLLPVILATQEAEIRRITIGSQPRQIVWEILCGKSPSQKRAGGVAEVVECLPSNNETLS
jgi:hypothetical protein